MTVRAGAAPGRSSIRPSPRAGDTAPTPQAEAPRPAGTLRLATRLMAVLRLAIRARPPSAGGLTDRQLADVGLTRSDLPDHRGWRR